MTKQFYLSVWRWHFFAGLYVVPFILMLSLSGLVMLASPWTDAWQYGKELTHVNAPALKKSVLKESVLKESVLKTVEKISADSQLAKVKRAYPHLIPAQYVPGVKPDQSNIIKMRGENFSTLLVFVDPYTGEILGDFDSADRWYSIADDIHGTLMMGKFGDALIELSAGLLIFLVLSGLYLHWPSNSSSVKSMLLPPNILAVLLTKKASRSAWRQVHSSLGFYLTLFILFFALTGMAWTGIWGQQLVQPFSSFPQEKSASNWRSDMTHGQLNDGQLNEIPWNLEQLPMPQSTKLDLEKAVQIDSRVSLDQIVEQGLELGFHLSEESRFRIALPLSTTGVYTLMSIASSRDVLNPVQDRTLHIDQYSADVLADIGWQDYGLGAKAMALGIPLHKGTLGLWNIILASTICLLLILLSLSAIILWWRRKPKGELAAPSAVGMQAISKSAKAFLLINLVLAVIFPVSGIAMAVFCLYECRSYIRARLQFS